MDILSIILVVVCSILFFALIMDSGERFIGQCGYGRKPTHPKSEDADKNSPSVPPFSV
jgi:hypothetical protein